MQDPFEYFGLPSATTKAQLKKHWHDLVLTIHPDYGGDPARFMEARMMYEKALAVAPKVVCERCEGRGQIYKAYGYSGIYINCPLCKGAVNEDSE